MNLLFLFLAVAALLAGPLLLQLKRGQSGLAGALDGFALITAGGLASLHLLPEALSHGGIKAAFAALLGLALPFIVERVNASMVKSRLTEEVITVVLFLGLLPHVALESASLGAQLEGSQLGLGVAIASHRLPVGLLLFSMLLRRHSPIVAWAGVALLVTATFGGYATGDSLGSLFSEEKLSWLQALVGGALLHVVSAHRLLPDAIPASSSCCDNDCATDSCPDRADVIDEKVYVHPCATAEHEHSHTLEHASPKSASSASAKSCCDEAAPTAPEDTAENSTRPCAENSCCDEAAPTAPEDTAENSTRPCAEKSCCDEAAPTAPEDTAENSTRSCAEKSCCDEAAPAAPKNPAENSASDCSDACGDSCGDAPEKHHHRFSLVHVWPALGALLGAFVVALAMLYSGEHEHAKDAHSFIDTFIGLALETAPALLFAYVLAGIIGTGMTSSHAAWLEGKSSLSSSLRGVLFGLPLPICSCGVLPLYEALVKRGVPVAAALGFLIATPELSLDALLISVPLLGPELSAARLVVAFLVAVLVSTLVGRGVARLGNLNEQNTEKRKIPFTQRLKEGTRFGLVELFDHTMPWVLAGLLMAALFEPLLGSQFFSSVPAFWQVPLFALLGIPVYVCASGATPVAAIAILKGVSPGAAIAFLLAGPATNLTTFGVLKDLHGRKVAISFGLGMTLAAMLSGWAIDALALNVLAQMNPHSHEEISPFKLGSLLILAVLLVGSLFRQGPRGVVEQVIRPSLGG